MPIYEYACGKCGKTIEVLQKMSDNPLRKHAGCGGSLSKLISASGFQFKGTGWYVTDYARKGQGGEAKGESGSAQDSKESKDSKDAKESKDSGGATETKSEGKKDAGPAKSAPKESAKPAKNASGSRDK
jgi:putative FmdB family regulatory protein